MLLYSDSARVHFLVYATASFDTPWDSHQFLYLVLICTGDSRYRGTQWGVMVYKGLFFWAEAFGATLVRVRWQGFPAL
jgi:hypothetical protein